ncbi:hypothetical protein AALP_AA8G466200 [Arabis alpina]|uniref:DUF1985 domain-containing protein n=1 Tax=Arabis alpina TaxID=50452 RepID=A0A087GDV6_ARAAL|nr:hypothetical protein AALP_AA8G466200 [Arabis alpina]
MLKRKTVTDKDIRLKYACLALLASVLMPTTHHPKIVKEHAKQIQDLSSFFAYPWGRLAFEMLLSSIKEKNEITLSQNTIAIKGFVHAIQLVMVESVPYLLEVVQDNSTSSSESDGERDKDQPREKKISLSPAHARDLHEEGKVDVDPIIADDGEEELDEAQFGWSDDEVDEKVENMVNLINKEESFCSAMFGGGVTKADVTRMIKESKEKKLKQKKGVCPGDMIGTSGAVGGGGGLNDSDVQHIVELVGGRVKVEFGVLETKVNEMYEKLDEIEDGRKYNDVCIKLEDLKNSISLIETTISLDVATQVAKMKTEVIDAIVAFLEKETTVHAADNETLFAERSNVNNVDKNQSQCGGSANIGLQKKVNPSSGRAIDSIIVGVLGDLSRNVTDAAGAVSVELQINRGNCSEVGDHSPSHNVVVNEDVSLPRTAVDGADLQSDNVENDGHGHSLFRKSKRLKTVPASLVQNYQCDKRMLQRLREAHLVGGYDLKVDLEAKFANLMGKMRQIS